MTQALAFERIPTPEATPALAADSQAAALAASIDFYSPISIQNFGAEIAEKTSGYTDEILSRARTSDLDETGARLNEIVLAAQSFDLDSLKDNVSKTPVVGGLLKRLLMTKEKAIARFETVRAQVDKLVAQIETTSETLARRNQDFQAMYEGVRQEHALLGAHVRAIELRLVDLDAEIETVSASATDLESSERLALLDSSRQQLAKRAQDMQVLQHAALQMLPMVRVIQANNLALVDKFRTIRQLTLPTWKRSFMLLLTLDEQKSAVALANTIDDATNSMMRRNAELLHQNSVATARANQRLVVDVETLRDVHDKILLTLSDVRKEHSEGAQKRKQAIGELERLRTEIVEGARTIALTNA